MTRCGWRSRYVAIETTRGWRITKHSAGHKIDIIVALAFAALGAAMQSGVGGRVTITDLWGEALPETSPDELPLTMLASATRCCPKSRRASQHGCRAAMLVSIWPETRNLRRGFAPTCIVELMLFDQFEEGEPCFFGVSAYLLHGKDEVSL